MMGKEAFKRSDFAKEFEENIPHVSLTLFVCIILVRHARMLARITRRINC